MRPPSRMAKRRRLPWRSARSARLETSGCRPASPSSVPFGQLHHRCGGASLEPVTFRRGGSRTAGGSSRRTGCGRPPSSWVKTVGLRLELRVRAFTEPGLAPAPGLAPRPLAVGPRAAARQYCRPLPRGSQQLAGTSRRPCRSSSAGVADAHDLELVAPRSPTPRSTRPVTTVPRPEIEKHQSSIGIRERLGPPPRGRLRDVVVHPPGISLADPWPFADLGLRAVSSACSARAARRS